MTSEFFNQRFVKTNALSMWHDNLIKILISLEEKWQTISYGKCHWKHCKVHKEVYVRKNTTLIRVTRRMIQADFNFKQQFNSLSFRLVLLKLKMLNRKATVTDQKWCVLDFFLPPLPLSLGHSGCIYDSKNMKFNCHMNNWFDFNISYTH